MDDVRKKDSEDFVRRVLAIFGQEADEATVARVAAKVRKAVPPYVRSRSRRAGLSLS